MVRSSEARDAIARAALAFVEENGADALTVRALGQATGQHHTAVYRHYRSKNELLSAVLGIVLEEGMAQIGALPADPSEQLFVLLRTLRSVFHDHPTVTVVYLLPSEVIAESDAAVRYQELVVAALRQLGLRGPELLVRYQMIESFVLGASVFDFGGAPDHLESRRRRHRLLQDTDFAEVSRDTAGVDALNEAAFEHALEVLVADCVAAGRRAADTALVGSGSEA